MQSGLVASRTGRAAHSDDIEVPFIGITLAVLVCACTSLAPLTQLLPPRVRGGVYVSFCPAVRLISRSAGMTLCAVESLWSFVVSGVCTQRICTACQHKRPCDSSVNHMCPGCLWGFLFLQGSGGVLDLWWW